MARIVRERVLGTKLSPPQKNTRGLRSGRKTSASSLISFSVVLAAALSFGALHLHAQGVDVMELASRPGTAILAAHHTLSETFGSSLAAVGGQLRAASDEPSPSIPSPLAPSTPSSNDLSAASLQLSAVGGQPSSSLAPSTSSPSFSFLSSGFEHLVSRIGYSLSFIACSFEEGRVWEHLECRDEPLAVDGEQSAIGFQPSAPAPSSNHQPLITNNSSPSSTSSLVPNTSAE